MTKGVMSTAGNRRGMMPDFAVPCETREVPCGMFANLATVSGSCGFVVPKTLIQIPGSIWITHPDDFAMCYPIITDLNSVIMLLPYLSKKRSKR
jgi:hypothetical protein